MSTVIELSIRVLVMAVLTAATLRLLRIRNAEARHTAWTAVLAAMLLLPAWSAWGPKLSTPLLPPPGDAPAHEALVLEDAAVTPQPVTQRPVESSRPGELPAQAWTWDQWAYAGYLLGLGVMLLRFLVGVLGVRALMRGSTQAGGVVSSPACKSPVTVGWLRPRIVLPANWRDWPKAELDAVMAHEREHVRRCDPLVQRLALWNRCVFWFHPLAWWLERKLAALAEEACDAAVIRRGCDRHEYSAYLIHLARTVEQSGGRLRVFGTAAGGGDLHARIRRILDGEPPAPISRIRSLLAASLCGTILVAAAACRLERAEKPAAGQPTMNELMHRRAGERQDHEKKRQLLVAEAEAMTGEQARALEAEIRNSPHDREKLFKLMRYYQHKVDTRGRIHMTLWYAEHRPEEPWGWRIQPEWDRAAYERCKQIWLEQVKQPGASAMAFQNAAAHLEGADKPLAEEVLLAGQKAHPSGNWAMPLGTHYALALLGSTHWAGEVNVVRTVSRTEADGPYARSVRAKLAASNDAAVLRQTAQWLSTWGRRFRSREDGLGFDPVELANSYLDRALAIAPDDVATRSIKLQISESRVWGLLRTPERVTGSERLALLRIQLDNLSMRRSEAAEAKARELLAAAEQDKSDPSYGDAVFFANLALGESALKRGERREAARYLLTASEAPPTDRLRYGEITMTLARQLVDWGEREAVATFLERCAKFNKRGKEMAEWAAQLRKGMNPDLLPYRT